ncbi:hypothetical protein ABZW30_38315 [Kitasatospora sp. NPDC004669]|uniref:hypothetical protein n=1 Tax=Kitasatospora sp. NPDC004669 TaxID=3154555 RepID=UPI0033B96330
MSESPGAVTPRTTWEHCLSAADELTRGQTPPDAEQHKRVVVLLAAVLAACAEGGGQVGAQIADLPMDGTGGALDMLEVAARLSVRVCPALPGPARPCPVSVPSSARTCWPPTARPSARRGTSPKASCASTWPQPRPAPYRPSASA